MSFAFEPLGFRADIEGLRAIAVIMVVLYHADIGPFSGGYIGVDVFFVVSGFLITSLLLAEASRTGTIHLASFWARRARRLLPASMLVVVVTLLLARRWYDPLLLGDLERDGLAAAGFAVNIVFAHRSSNGGGGYFDTELAASPLLHFWSLAVEEQFYVVWPLAVWLMARMARRVRADLTTVITVACLASFVACLALTDRNQPWAFYSLPTRAWELLAGALLAMSIASLRRLRRRTASLLTLAGVITVGSASVVFDHTTTFPGFAALAPVLGTGMIVAGCSSRTAPAGVARLLGARPLVWIGQRSYALYLWHWPALVLAGVEWGPLSVGGRVAAVGVSAAIATATYTVIENPVRHAAWLRAGTHRSLVLGGVLLIVAASVAGLLLWNPPSTSGSEAAPTLELVLPADVVETTVDAVVPLATDVSTTTISSSMTTTLPPTVLDGLIAAEQALLEQGAAVTEVPSNLVPALAEVRGDQPSLYDDGCVLDFGVTETPRCVYGDTSASTSVAVLGDSHAAQWFPALQRIAVDHHWRLLYFAKVGCPPSEQLLRNHNDADCDPWRTQAIADIVAARPQLIILTGYHYDPPDGAGSADELWRDGMTTTITELGDLGPRVLILGDTPTQFVDVAECLAGHVNAAGACVSERSYAVRENRLQVEREVAAQFGAATADTSDWLCTPSTCPVILGNLLLYRDRNHITTAAAEFLAPLLEATLTPLIP